jgi:hypothetical protein
MGRPRLPPEERRDHRVEIALTAAEHEALLRQAEADEGTAAETARELMLRALRRKRRTR